MLELHAQGSNGPSVYCPTLVWDEKDAILIDTGLPGMLGQIQAAMEQAGVPFQQLRAVILTHQDLDHIGSLPAILEAAGGGVEVYAHALEQPYIEGQRPLLKSLPPGALEKLPPHVRAMFANPPKARVDKLLEDGQVLPYCGGIRAIFTPGHTLGHISLYLEEQQVLVTGDAMVYANGALQGPVPQVTHDVETAVQSLQKFSGLQPDAVVCYHGGLCKENAKEQLQALLERAAEK